MDKILASPVRGGMAGSGKRHIKGKRSAGDVRALFARASPERLNPSEVPLVWAGLGTIPRPAFLQQVHHGDLDLLKAS